MRAALVLAALFTLIAFGPAEAVPEGNGGTFPGGGATNGTFPGGGATNGTFPGGNGGTNGTVSASEPLSLVLTAGGLVAAALIRRRRR